MSEFVGIEEDWVEKGWTKKQMRDRIEELSLTTNLACMLIPYELNFMQNPDANAETLQIVEQMSEAGDYNYVKYVSNLWTPGETITVSFSGGNQTLYDSAKKYILQDIQPNVSMKFNFVANGGRINVMFGNFTVTQRDQFGMGREKRISRIRSLSWLKLERTVPKK